MQYWGMTLTEGNVKKPSKALGCMFLFASFGADVQGQRPCNINLTLFVCFLDVYRVF